MKTNLIYLFLITILMGSCTKDELVNDSSNPMQVDQFQTSEVDSRAVKCELTYTVDDQGCCVYNLPFEPEHFYKVGNSKMNGGFVTVCEGESVSVEFFQVKPGNLSGVRRICSQELTCSCCDQINYSLTYHSEEPNCCRIELDFDRPQCVRNDIVTSFSPHLLGDDFSVTTIRKTQSEHDIRICGPGWYPEGAYLFLQFKIDEQCKSDEINIPLNSCY